MYGLQRLYRRDAQCAPKTRVIQRCLGEHCSPLRIHNVQMGHTADCPQPVSSNDRHAFYTYVWYSRSCTKVQKEVY